MTSYQVFYLPHAEQDLIEIFVYGSEKWGEAQAERMYKQITEQLETLYSSPYRTQRKGSFNTREMLILNSPYRAIIKIEEELKKVFILRILHTSQDFYR